MLVGMILCAIVVIKGMLGYKNADLAWMLPPAAVGAAAFVARKSAERL